MSASCFDVRAVWPEQIARHYALPARRRDPMTGVWSQMTRERALATLPALPLLDETAASLSERVTAMRPGEQITVTAAHPRQRR